MYVPAVGVESQLGQTLFQTQDPDLRLVLLTGRLFSFFFKFYYFFPFLSSSLLFLDFFFGFSDHNIESRYYQIFRLDDFVVSHCDV